ncbi:hypothetical protein CI610_02828 [invertebrate metagenome]|jgi:hypothetical protein|uniref:Uncharacterized protein n=1 Tax=invertebrate metagenome TaxID=1711999 RepID=A0A2H9T4T1_9ZZZZ
MSKVCLGLDMKDPRYHVTNQTYKYRYYTIARSYEHSRKCENQPKS